MVLVIPTLCAICNVLKCGGDNELKKMPPHTEMTASILFADKSTHLQLANAVSTYDMENALSGKRCHNFERYYHVILLRQHKKYISSR
jgi:hypothetical protein